MNLHQLVYISVATSQMNAEQLLALLSAAKANNEKIEVTGALLFDSGRFIQILEGDKEVVETLYNKIAGDSRHQKVRKLYFEPANSRLFPRWSMNMINLDSDKPKNLSELKSILSSLESEEKGSHTQPAPIRLFNAFRAG